MILFNLLGIFILINYTFCEQILLGLNEQLAEFNACNIRIENPTPEIIWNPLTVPHELATKPRVKIHYAFEHLPYRPRALFKYGEIQCTLDVLILVNVLNSSVFNLSENILYTSLHSSPDFVLVVVHESAFQKRISRLRFQEWMSKYIRVMQRTVLVQTVTHIVEKSLKIVKSFYVCEGCFDEEKYADPNQIFEISSKLSPSYLEIFVKKLHRTIIWNLIDSMCTFRTTIFQSEPPVHHRNRRAGRTESSRLGFHRFMSNLIYSINATQFQILRKNRRHRYHSNPASFCFSSNIDKETPLRLVFTSQNGYNFITCHSTDTFWTMAGIFAKTYKVEV